MDILLQFYLVKKKSENKFLFWSCVLNTYLDDVDFIFLNNDNEIKIESFNDYSLNINYRIFKHFDELTEENNSDYKRKDFLERPEYFLSNDQTFQKGSPYKHASSLVKTYYQYPEKFISDLKQFMGEGFSDYKSNSLMREIIKSIKKTIGISIFDHGSVPGSFSIYKKLPAFEIKGNYRLEKEDKRYISLIPVNKKEYDGALIEIETRDNDKILSKNIQPYSKLNKYKFPTNTEIFSQFQITLFEKQNAEYHKIFEERFSLVRKINLSFGISGGNSKIVKTRFIQNKKEEKISISDYNHSISGKDDNWIDWELELKEFIYGKNKKNLESQYFEKSPEGRNGFLNWVRSKVQGSKKVTIVDPYFDHNGVNDFFSCIDTNPEIIIITTNPDDNERDNRLTKEALSNLIFDQNQKVKLYYAKKEKFHDRYFILEGGRDSFFYNMSNSWNGTVNNHSLLVQEVPQEIALHISEEINEYYNKENAETKPVKLQRKENENQENKDKYDDAYIIKIKEDILKIDVANISNKEEFINLLSEPFRAHYFGKIEDKENDLIFGTINSILKSFPSAELKDLAIIIINKLLENQRNKFIETKKFFDEKPIGFYNTPENCIFRINHIINFGHSLDFELKLDYSLSNILELIFKIIPNDVIELLKQLEEKICVVDIDDKEPFHYFVSELIISQYLINSFYFIKYLNQETIEFSSKITSWIYPKLFIAKNIFLENKGVTFEELLRILNDLKIELKELFVLLVDFVQEAKKNKKENEYNESFEKAAIQYININYEEFDKIRFAYQLYIEPYELNLEGLDQYLECLNNSGQKNTSKKIENVLLCKSLESNKNLMEKVVKLIDQENEILYQKILKDNSKQQFTDIVTEKYSNYISIFAKIFSERVKENNNLTKMGNLASLLNTNKNLIFNLDFFPEKMGLYYYYVLFFLNAVLYIDDKANQIIRKFLHYLEWYLPACLTANSDDFYGLSINVIDIYTFLMEEDEKKYLFLQNVFDMRSRILIMSSINKQEKDFIEEYKMFFDDKYVIKNNDNAKSIISLLNMFINLCIKCGIGTNKGIKDEITELLENIRYRFEKKINPNALEIITSGIAFANVPTEENKTNFYETMKKCYLPYAVLSSRGEINGK